VVLVPQTTRLMVHRAGVLFFQPLHLLAVDSEVPGTPQLDLEETEVLVVVAVKEMMQRQILEQAIPQAQPRLKETMGVMDLMMEPHLAVVVEVALAQWVKTARQHLQVVLVAQELRLPYLVHLLLMPVVAAVQDHPLVEQAVLEAVGMETEVLQESKTERQTPEAVGVVHHLLAQQAALALSSSSM
jgi:hypothetical protein